MPHAINITESDIDLDFEYVFHTFSIPNSLLQSFKNLEQLAILGNVSHIICILCKSNGAFLINDKQRRHTPQFYQVPFLAVEFSNFPIWIMDTNIRNVLFLPIFLYLICFMRCNHNDLSFPVSERLDILFHLSQMLSGKWSNETPQQNKYNGSIFDQVGKIYVPAVTII